MFVCSKKKKKVSYVCNATWHYVDFVTNVVAFIDFHFHLQLVIDVKFK